MMTLFLLQATSALSIEEIGKYAKHPENVIGLHYFSPLFLKCHY